MSALQEHFQQIHALIRQGKTRALAAATTHSLESYWNVGAYLSHRLIENTYGKNVVNQLADWLKQTDPSLKGYDWRSLYRMREFFEQWSDMDWSLAGLASHSSMHQSAEGDIYLPEKILGSVIPRTPLADRPQ